MIINSNLHSLDTIIEINISIIYVITIIINNIFLIIHLFLLNQINTDLRNYLKLVYYSLTTFAIIKLKL
jgi:hypothetical protein